LGAVGGTVLAAHRPVAARGRVRALQVGSLACALLAVNQLRDVDEDRAAGKGTLAARAGPRFGRARDRHIRLRAVRDRRIWAAAERPWAALLPLAPCRSP